MSVTKHYYTRFEEHKVYHIYNRTVDRKPMFKSEDNYKFFLQRYDHYLSPVLDTFAYCLLGNHFHLLVRVKDLSAIKFDEQSSPTDVAPRTTDLSTFQKLTNLPRVGAPRDGQTRDGQSHTKDPNQIISHQFRKFFQSYAMAFNKQHERIGTLFQTPFKRALVDNDRYFQNMVCYIHHNPQQHRLVDDFRKWPWSSYGRMLTDTTSKLSKQEVLNWFGGKGEYTATHCSATNFADIDSLVIEDE